MRIFRLVWKSLCVVWLVEGSVEPMAEELRDPFLFGPREAVAVTAQPVLNGILWDARSPLAVIEGEPVVVGQTVGGWQVIEIQPDRIVIQRDSQRQLIAPGDSFPAE